MRKKCRSHSSESGQVLALVLVLVCILVIAAFVLFDLQAVIRAKIKVDLASQAGALAAANWQKETLNIIGELNLVKASKILLEDIPPHVDPEHKPLSLPELETYIAKISASVKLISELQTRAAFIGPLIGFGAAEQAVKNNGINGDGSTMHREIDVYLRKLQVNEDDRYYEPVNGYKWKIPYMAVLRSIQDSSALAVCPSGTFAGISNADPAWLGDSSLYRAIAEENWCHPVLVRLLKTYNNGFWDNDWFRVNLFAARFPGESEIYTLDCDWYSSQLNDDESEFIKNALKKRGLEYLEISSSLTDWCFYGSSWFPWSGRYTGPDLTLWQGPERDGGGPYYYLRSNLLPHTVHGGPVAAVSLAQDIDTANDLAGTGKVNDPVRHTGKNAVEVSNYSVARVLGKIGKDKPPVAMPLVMPVFSETVLIPGSLMRFRFMNVENRNLERFLIWLSHTDSIFTPVIPPPAGTSHFLAALQKLATPEWRYRGWNPMWRVTDPYSVAEAMLAGGEWPEGNVPGWLQTPVVYREINDEYPDDIIREVVLPDGTREFHCGDRYIVLRPNGEFQVNEGAFCREGYGGGGGPAGPWHI